MSRAVIRAATAGLTGLVTVVLTSLPAYADDIVGPHEGADPGKELGTAETLLLNFGIPLLLCLIIAAIVWLPGAMRANRYRPNKPWNASPVWFAGPAEPVAAVQSADTGDVTRGGASGSW